MEKFCNFITNPAWWSVIFSAISAIAVIVIAIMQIRLQRRQIKTAEFETYRQLYKFIYKLDNEIDSFVLNVCSVLWESNQGRDFIKQRKESVNNLRKELSQNIIDLACDCCDQYGIHSDRIRYCFCDCRDHALHSCDCRRCHALCRGG